MVLTSTLMRCSVTDLTATPEQMKTQVRTSKVGTSVAAPAMSASERSPLTVISEYSSRWFCKTLQMSEDCNFGKESIDKEADLGTRIHIDKPTKNEWRGGSSEDDKKEKEDR